MTQPSDIPRRSGGERPYFFDDPAVDQLYAMLLAAAAELSVARDRIDTLERLLVAKGLLEPGEVDGFEPDEQAEDQRTARRGAFVARLLACLGTEGQSLSPAADMPAYSKTLEELRSG